MTREELYSRMSGEQKAMLNELKSGFKQASKSENNSSQGDKKLDGDSEESPSDSGSSMAEELEAIKKDILARAKAEAKQGVSQSRPSENNSAETVGVSYSRDYRADDLRQHNDAMSEFERQAKKNSAEEEYVNKLTLMSTDKFLSNISNGEFTERVVLSYIDRFITDRCGAYNIHNRGTSLQELGLKSLCTITSTLVAVDKLKIGICSIANTMPVIVDKIASSGGFRYPNEIFNAFGFMAQYLNYMLQGKYKYDEMPDEETVEKWQSDFEFVYNLLLDKNEVLDYNSKIYPIKVNFNNKQIINAYDIEKIKLSEIGNIQVVVQHGILDYFEVGQVEPKSEAQEDDPVHSRVWLSKACSMLVAVEKREEFAMVYQYIATFFNKMYETWSSGDADTYEKLRYYGFYYMYRNAIENGLISYNQVPDDKMLNSWLVAMGKDMSAYVAQEPDIESMTVDINGYADGSENDIPVDMSNIYPEGAEQTYTERPIENIFFTIANTGKIIFDRFRPEQDVVKLADDTVNVEQLGFLDKIKAKAFESRTGMSYYMHKTWEHILDTVSKQVKGDNLRIKRFAIIYPGITANNTYTDLQTILGSDITLDELVDIPLLLKRFPNIQELILDAQSTSTLIDDYGADAKAMWNIFKSAPKLQRLVVMTFDGRQVFDRQNFAEQAERVDKVMSRERDKKVLEAHMARYNPRVSQNPGLMYRFSKTMSGHAADFFENAHSAVIVSKDEKAKYGRWIAHTGLGLLTLGVAGVMGAPHWISNKLHGIK